MKYCHVYMTMKMDSSDDPLEMRRRNDDDEESGRSWIDCISGCSFGTLRNDVIEPT